MTVATRTSSHSFNVRRVSGRPVSRSSSSFLPQVTTRSVMMHHPLMKMAHTKLAMPGGPSSFLSLVTLTMMIRSMSRITPTMPWHMRMANEGALKKSKLHSNRPRPWWRDEDADKEQHPPEECEGQEEESEESEKALHLPQDHLGRDNRRRVVGDCSQAAGGLSPSAPDSYSRPIAVMVVACLRCATRRLPHPPVSPLGSQGRLNATRCLKNKVVGHRAMIRMRLVSQASMKLPLCCLASILLPAHARQKLQKIDDEMRVATSFVARASASVVDYPVLCSKWSGRANSLSLSKLQVLVSCTRQTLHVVRMGPCSDLRCDPCGQPGRSAATVADEKKTNRLACESAPYLFQNSPTSSLPRILHATPVSDDTPSHNFAAG
ncbi:hypothetical protein KC349_g60 [Hortaea werneckii]|nr:hypothetical protein KC349_g60 [Hortaea werneckii]